MRSFLCKVAVQGMVAVCACGLVSGRGAIGGHNLGLQPSGTQRQSSIAALISARREIARHVLPPFSWNASVRLYFIAGKSSPFFVIRENRKEHTGGSMEAYSRKSGTSSLLWKAAYQPLPYPLEGAALGNWDGANGTLVHLLQGYGPAGKVPGSAGRDLEVADPMVQFEVIGRNEPIEQTFRQVVQNSSFVISDVGRVAGIEKLTGPEIDLLTKDRDGIEALRQNRVKLMRQLKPDDSRYMTSGGEGSGYGISFWAGEAKVAIQEFSDLFIAPAHADIDCHELRHGRSVRVFKIRLDYPANFRYGSPSRWPKSIDGTLARRLGAEGLKPPTEGQLTPSVLKALKRRWPLVSYSGGHGPMLGRYGVTMTPANGPGAIDMQDGPLDAFDICEAEREYCRTTLGGQYVRSH